MAITLKYGDENEDVRLVQKALNEIIGLRNKPDGHFGKMTEEAVRTYQQKQALPVTGVVDDAVWKTLLPYINNRYVSVDNLIHAAKEINIPVAMMMAIREVEARSDGFLPDGRPIILFERHKFYHYLSLKKGKNYADSIVRTQPNVCNPERGGYLGYEAEYDRINKALSIDNECGYYSASWGMFQIMGFNHKRAGYPYITDFIKGMYESEVNHLRAVCNFIVADSKMVMAAKQKNFKRFAELYNGAGQQGYDTKLKTAHDKYAKLGF